MNACQFSLFGAISFEIEKLFAMALLGGLAISAVLFLTVARFSIRFMRLKLGRMHRPKLPRVSKSSEHLPSFLPATLGISITCFGMFGLILRVLFGLPATTSVAGAAVLSVALFSALVAMTQRMLASTAKAMEGNSLLGSLAHVCLAIPEDGVGSIAYVAEGKRHTMPARSEQCIEKGARVLVTDLQNRVAVVEEF